MDLYKELLSKVAKAAETGGFAEVFSLYQFLDEHGDVALYEAVGNEVEKLAQDLNNEEKQRMREEYGVSFPEDMENVPALMSLQPPLCDGCNTNHWPYQDCFHNGLF